MSKNYQNRLLLIFHELQSDLKDKRINEEQFNFLVSILLSNEINKFIKKEIYELLPDTDEDNSQKLTFVSYKKNRTYSYA